MKPHEHLNKIVKELVKMGEDGHLNEFGADACAGAVHYEVSKLREILDNEELEKK